MGEQVPPSAARLIAEGDQQPPDREPLRAENRLRVVFIHCLWLHATSWRPWADLFAEHGYERHHYWRS